MKSVDELRRKLDELKRAGPTRLAATGGAAPSPAGSHRPAAPRHDHAASLADVLGGRQIEVSGGCCWLVESAACITRPLPRQVRFEDAPVIVRRSRAASARRGEHPDGDLEWGRVILLDLETGGFSGTPVFLVGVLRFEADSPAIEQYLVRDYPEEAAVLRAFAAVVRERDVWVSFNGRSFDEPFLRDRAVRHRVTLPLPREHLDVLHLARRRWGRDLPNCKLTTLERCILGRERFGDVPGCDIPDLFHHFVRTGNARPLRPILEHNRLDLLATLELLLRLGEHA